MLRILLGSQSRAEILKNLFVGGHPHVHLRELARISNISAPVLLRELRQLAETGIISAEEDGNRVNYSANEQHVLYPVLCELVAKTEGPVELLRQAFSCSSARQVFIFGSFAKGTANAQSDIDLFVIGPCGLREITKTLRQISDRIHNEINPYVISQEEFKTRLKARDHFLMEMIDTPKIFLKGTPDEFAAMAE